MRRTQIRRGPGPKRRTTLRSVGKRGLRLKDLDKILHEVILTRDGHRCRKCNAPPQPGRGNALQAAHVYGKLAHPAMRYYLPNVITLCQRCHFGWWHKVGFGREAAPNNEVRDWCVLTLGPDYMQALDAMAGERSQGKPKRDMRRIEAELREALNADVGDR